MQCPYCGADQTGCDCATPTALARGQAERGNTAVRAASEANAELLAFLHDFGSGPAARVPVQAPFELPLRPRAPLLPPVPKTPTVPGAVRWAPPSANERVASVPFLPLAIVPLPLSTGPDGQDDAALDALASRRRYNEVLPNPKQRRHFRRHQGKKREWKRSALVGTAVGMGVASLLAVLLMSSPKPVNPAGQIVKSPSTVIVAHAPIRTAARSHHNP